MLSNVDLERLIAIKRREIEKEKTLLGFPSKTMECQSEDPPATREEGSNTTNPKIVQFDSKEPLQHYYKEEQLQKDDKNEIPELEPLPPDLERYIRRYLGLPVMLKAGEYSPNNPLLRDDRQRGTRDVFVGLGEYEERCNTLRKIRQKEYRQFLEQQAKLKQEAKEREEKERLKQEQRERERERLIQERERQYNYVPERVINTTYTDTNKPKPERDEAISSSSTHTVKRDGYASTSELEKDRYKVDTGVQVNGRAPLSVGVQTDDDLYHLPTPENRTLTLAERELSPRTVLDRYEYNDGTQTRTTDYDYDGIPKSNRAKLMCDLRHTYLPSIIEGDAIQHRNLQQQQEAAHKKQSYQQELKHQIEEQQRIREERKAREKMLEEAELRRLEEQLKMLRLAQERETDKQQLITVKLRDYNKDFNNLKISLQKDIDKEKHTLFKSIHRPEKKNIHCSNDNNHISKLPFYYPSLPIKRNKKPYSFNIPDNSIFSKNYDLESHLKRNLNPSKESLFSNNVEKKTSSKFSNNDLNIDIESLRSKMDKSKDDLNKIERNSNETLSYEPKFLRQDIKDLIVTNNNNIDDTPIPVLRHSPNLDHGNEMLSDTNNNESKIKVVEDKWQVPAVQKNILKSMPSADGDKVSILTQLGSIRRQLQMEQIRLDQMLSKKVGD